MSDTNRTAFKTVSQYLNAGGMSLGLYLMESPIRETEKALAFPCVQSNSYGNPYNGAAWLPKSQLTKVQNDFYTDGPKEMFLCPEWLYRKNFHGGEVLVCF
jgi:hypothetical protein